MSVPQKFCLRIRPASHLLRILAALLLLLVIPSAFAKGPEPPLRLPLEPMGFQPPGAGALAIGGILSTVDFIDEQHLLVTFSVRRLMKRLPEDPPGDQDRTIEAIVVHLPSGKVLARTNWRAHDYQQYLWNLGHGRFLLRIRDTLSTFIPLANLPNGDPFVLQPLIQSGRRVGAILLSPDRDLITIETLNPSTIIFGDSDTASASRPAQLNFYRILQPVQPIDRVILQSAGVALAAGLLDLSLTSSGYIEVAQESSTRWLFDFDPYVGKFVELSPFDTSCRPRPIFVSASEFVAFGCRGGSDRSEIGGFNMRGEQMWQQDFIEAHTSPNFSFAPAAGRFALSRNLVAAGAGIAVDFAPSSVTMQEVSVYQTSTGKRLLRVEAAPVQKAGFNYDLSPDGLRLAVIRNGAIELHRLPNLTEVDEKAIKAAKVLQPAETNAPVNLRSHGKPGSPSGPPAQASEPLAPAPPIQIQPPAEPAANPMAGDPTPGERRKPPTLYTLPTDKPQQDQGKPQ
jgi:hypothetical protein